MYYPSSVFTYDYSKNSNTKIFLPIAPCEFFDKEDEIVDGVGNPMKTDARKLGAIKFQYGTRIIVASPILGAFNFETLNYEWIKQNARRLEGLCEYIEQGWYYYGFRLISDQSQYPNKPLAHSIKEIDDKLKSNYPYDSIIFSSDNWVIYKSDKKDKHVFKIVHKDGSIFEIDETKDKESIKIFNQKFQNSIIFNKDGIKIIGLEKETIHIKKDSIEIENSSNSTIKLDKFSIMLTTNKDIIINSPQVKITGGQLEVNGTASPSPGQGAFNCIPNCLFTGAPHTATLITGT